VSERERLVRMEQDNQVWHRFLHEVHADFMTWFHSHKWSFQKSSELWDLMEKLRELGVDLDSRKGFILVCLVNSATTNRVDKRL
jgi:hypothetical protein